VIGEAFAETADAMRHWPGFFSEFLKSAPNPLMCIPRDQPSRFTALITVAAHEIFLLRFHVAEARNINSIRTIAKWHLVFMPGIAPLAPAPM